MVRSITENPTNGGQRVANATGEWIEGHAASE